MSNKQNALEVCDEGIKHCEHMIKHAPTEPCHHYYSGKLSAFQLIKQSLLNDNKEIDESK